MKKIFAAAVVLGVTGMFALPAFAGDDAASMNMPMTKRSPSKQPADTTLTDAEIVNVDPSTGIKHGELANIGMAAMTMAYKAKDVSMVRQIHQGEKVRVRVENVGGTLTIVKIVKVS